MPSNVIASSLSQSIPVLPLGVDMPHNAMLIGRARPNRSVGRNSAARAPVQPLVDAVWCPPLPLKETLDLPPVAEHMHYRMFE